MLVQLRLPCDIGRHGKIEQGQSIVFAVSLGVNCQVAHQIRRATGQREAFFFDWIVTEHAALLKATPLHFTSILESENLQLATNRKSVLDLGSGLRFYLHDFPSKDGVIDPETLEASGVAIRDKYLRRAERTRSLLLSGSPVVLVRYVHGPSPDVLMQQRSEIMDAFRRNYPQGNLSFLWVTDSDAVAATLGIPCAPPSPLGWTGDNAAWDRAFTFAPNLPVHRQIEGV